MGGSTERLTSGGVRLRKCIGCGTLFPKSSLMRIVRSASGEVSVDASRRAEGRGTYLCANIRCVKEAGKKNAIARALKCPVDREIYTRIAESLGNDCEDGIV